MSTELINKIKEIILDNNYFDSCSGEKFKEWNDIKNITAVTSFCSRSKKRECYRLPVSSESDSEMLFVSHLYLNRYGDVMVQMTAEDTDDINVILHPSDEPIENFDEEMVEEWADLLTY